MSMMSIALLGIYKIHVCLWLNKAYLGCMNDLGE